MYPSKWTIRKNLKDQVYALIQQLCTLRSKINLKKCLHNNTALSAQHTMSSRFLPLTIFIDPTTVCSPNSRILYYNESLCMFIITL